MTPIPILLYHSVGYTRAPDYRRWCVEPSRFDDHLAALADGGYDFLTVSGLIDALASDTLPARPLVITFDDGRADFVEFAVPALSRRGQIATMYVVSGHVGGTSSWLRIPGESDQPMMDWSDLVDIAAAGHEVGAHSRNHPELDIVPRPRARDEIDGSKRDLEAGLGRAVRSFAYPHGYRSQTTIALTRASGFDSACGVEDRWSWVGEDAFGLSRLIVGGETTAAALLERLAAPPAAPERRIEALRAGWRGVRWARQRAPIGAHS